MTVIPFSQDKSLDYKNRETKLVFLRIKKDLRIFLLVTSIILNMYALEKPKSCGEILHQVWDLKTKVSQSVKFKTFYMRSLIVFQ